MYFIFLYFYFNFYFNIRSSWISFCFKNCWEENLVCAFCRLFQIFFRIFIASWYSRISDFDFYVYLIKNRWISDKISCFSRHFCVFRVVCIITSTHQSMKMMSKCMRKIKSLIKQETSPSHNHKRSSKNRNNFTFKNKF